MSKDINNQIQILKKKFEARQFKEVINESLIILKKSDNDFLWNIVGLSFQHLNQYKKSIDCFENAIQVNSKNFTAYNNLGISYKKLKQYKKAEDYLLRAIEINPNYVNAMVNIGNVKNETYFFDDAIKYYKKAIELNNKLPLIYLNLATVYQTINKIDESKKYLIEALNIDETFTIADQKLSMLEKYDIKNLHLQKMINKLNSEKLNVTQNKYLCFGISKAFKDLKDYQNSFKYLKRGNELQRKSLNYDIEFHRSLSKKIKLIFSKINFKDFEKTSEGKNQIFILGMPRSGTTLIEKIISSHSKVSTISESNFIPEKVHGFLNKDFDELKKILNSSFQNKYYQFIKSFNIKDEIVVDKTLTNFWYLGFIKILFPESKIIHISRNPKDNCLSIFENLFDYPEGWNWDQEELAEYYLIYQDLMKFWSKLFENSIYNIKYEDVILNTNTKIKELINFCGLEWEEACLNFHENNNPIKTVSFNQANKPIYKSSLEKHKLYEKELDILFSKLN